MTGEDKAHARRMAKDAPLRGRPRDELRRLLGILPDDFNKARVPLDNLTPVDHG
jgi:hypothetical protein